MSVRDAIRPAARRRARRASPGRSCCRRSATIALVALFPLVWTVWESLHLHDLRMPWLGRPVRRPAQLRRAARRRALLGALAHTAISSPAPSPLELACGLVLALALDRVTRGRGLVRTAVLLPWAIPTVVAALVWRFMFESRPAWSTRCSRGAGAGRSDLVRRPIAAWVPLVLADVVEDDAVRRAAAARRPAEHRPRALRGGRRRRRRAWQQFSTITLPLLRPALLVALLFRALDAFRVFDLVYVMTGGGPGTATEPIALYTFTTLLQNLRFGYGSALSVIVFVGGVRARARLHPRARRRRAPGAIGMTGIAARGRSIAGAARAAIVCSRSTGRVVRRSRRRAGCSARRRSAAALVARPLPRAVRRARLLDADPQLAGGRRRDDGRCR